MAKPDTTSDIKKLNPFLSEEADLLWDRLKKSKKSVTKEDILKRINKVKGDTN